MATTPPNSSTNTMHIDAPRETVYHAFADPELLEQWLAPGDMTGHIDNFDHQVGGGYTMTLRYPDSAADHTGKSTENEDTYTARYLEITPPSRIVQSIIFDTTDPTMTSDMTMTVTLEPADSGTDVTITFANLPPGVSAEDNEAGTRLSLEKLAKLLET